MKNQNKEEVMFEVLSANDFMEKHLGKRRDYWIKGVLPESGLVGIFGRNDTAKTFLALDIAMNISNGIGNWMGKKSKKGRVMFFSNGRPWYSFEIVGAWLRHYDLGIDNDSTKFVFADEFSIGNDDDRTKLENKINKDGFDVVVMDVLNFLESREIVQGYLSLKSNTNALIVFTDPMSKKDLQEEPESHGGHLFYGKVDGFIEVTERAGKRYFQVLKGPAGWKEKQEFKLEDVVIGVDEDGCEVMSCVPALVK